MMAREFRLKRALEGVRGAYDYVLIDCPPSLGLLTVNALTAADEVIVPVQCEYLALEGLGQLTATLELVRRNLNPQLQAARPAADDVRRPHESLAAGRGRGARALRQHVQDA